MKSFRNILLPAYIITMILCIVTSLFLLETDVEARQCYENGDYYGVCTNPAGYYMACVACGSTLCADNIECR